MERNVKKRTMGNMRLISELYKQVRDSGRHDTSSMGCSMWPLHRGCCQGGLMTLDCKTERTQGRGVQGGPVPGGAGHSSTSSRVQQGARVWQLSGHGHTQVTARRHAMAGHVTSMGLQQWPAVVVTLFLDLTRQLSANAAWASSPCNMQHGGQVNGRLAWRAAGRPVTRGYLGTPELTPSEGLIRSACMMASGCWPVAARQLPLGAGVLDEPQPLGLGSN
jgi:hypothetical protein